MSSEAGQMKRAKIQLYLYFLGTLQKDLLPLIPI